MAIFVDEAENLYHGKYFCHMLTDQFEQAELHAFARQIGVKPCWFHNPKPGDHPHYDLTQFQRKRALANGAQCITGKRYIIEIVRPRRAKLAELAEQKCK